MLPAQGTEDNLGKKDTKPDHGTNQDPALCIIVNDKQLFLWRTFADESIMGEACAHKLVWSSPILRGKMILTIPRPVINHDLIYGKDQQGSFNGNHETSLTFIFLQFGSMKICQMTSWKTTATGLPTSDGSPRVEEERCYS